MWKTLEKGATSVMNNPNIFKPLVTFDQILIYLKRNDNNKLDFVFTYHASNTGNRKTS